ncbi:hypothetical protein MtrunA17_Chr2g0281771 [Medicago truncatula]|uniref:Transmembrane protein n=1 Tax=Medicago truncatula TaxID=3880 RepID=A0A396J5Z0_MEDTR|nr:hypothetical protein MtrunA17_Chr2g0281771 [Medicago truncatula]
MSISSFFFGFPLLVNDFTIIVWAIKFFVERKKEDVMDAQNRKNPTE